MSEKTIVDFQTKVRALILQFQSLKEENKELYAMLEKSEEENKRIVAELNDVKKQFDSYKMAKMIEVADGDITATKAKLQKLIRDVNRCITLLTEK